MPFWRELTRRLVACAANPTHRSGEDEEGRLGEGSPSRGYVRYLREEVLGTFESEGDETGDERPKAAVQVRRIQRLRPTTTMLTYLPRLTTCVYDRTPGSG